MRKVDCMENFSSVNIEVGPKYIFIIELWGNHGDTCESKTDCGD